MKKLALVSLGIIFSLSANALSLLNPTYGGSGCVAGSASIKLDGAKLSRLNVTMSSMIVSGADALAPFDRSA
jgi:hypothetical protein